MSFEVARKLLVGYCKVVPEEFDSRMEKAIKPAEAVRSMEAVELAGGPVVEFRLREGTNRQRLFLIAKPKVEENILRDGQAVEIQFLQRTPSRFWSDPYCRITGVVDAKNEVHRHKHFRAWVAGEPMAAQSMEGLCIPTYDVPAEFRELLYVREPLWRSIKRHVVEKVFLTEQHGNPLRATIIKLRDKTAQTGTEPIVACDPYEEVLKREWKGYKALEDALSLGRFYKNARIQESTAGEIWKFVERELIETKLIRKLVKTEKIEERFYGVEYVFRVFYGLVNRYRFLGTQAWARQNPKGVPG